MRRFLAKLWLLMPSLSTTACTLDTASDPASSDDTAEVGEIQSELASDVVRSDGPFRLRNYHSGRCLEVPGNSKNNVGLDQWDCIHDVKKNEDWYLDWIDSNWFRIRNRNSGKCMNVEGASWYAGARIIQYKCGNYQNEYFFRSKQSGDSWWIFGTDTLALNIEGASQANGARLIQWYPEDRSNEYFLFIASSLYE